MVRRVVPLIAVMSLVLVFSVHAVLSAQSEPDHVTISIGATQLGTANTRIADVEGYFAAQNIELEYVSVSGQSDAESIALLINGDLDVLQSSWTPGIFNAITRGAQIKVVAVPTYNDPESCSYSALLVRGEQAENFDLESLRGAHVALSSGTGTYFFDRWLSTQGMSISDVISEDIPNAARAEALLNGTVDLIWLSEPSVTRVMDEFGFEIAAGIADILPDSSVSVLIFGPGMLNREDDLPVRYLTAYLQGSRQFNEGPTERNIEILSTSLEMEPEILTNTCWIPFRETGLLNGDTALDYMNWTNEHGLLDETLELDEFYDPSYVEQAYERLTAMESEAEATAAE